jgi:hypothetical protein
MFAPNTEKTRSCQASSGKPPAAGPAGWALKTEKVDRATRHSDDEDAKTASALSRKIMHCNMLVADLQK